MSKEKKDPTPSSSHPTIIETEDKEIPEIKPPNDKILKFLIVSAEENKKGSV